MPLPWNKPDSGPREIILEHRLLEGDLKPVVEALLFLLEQEATRAQGDGIRSRARTLEGNLSAAISK